MRSQHGWPRCAVLLCLASLAGAAQGAEVLDARCRVEPDGGDARVSEMRCSIQQEQGLVLIRREDGVVHDLRPAGDKPGLYMDQNGGSAYGRPLSEENGFLFRFTDESLEIRW